MSHPVDKIVDEKPNSELLKWISEDLKYIEGFAGAIVHEESGHRLRSKVDSVVRLVNLLRKRENAKEKTSEA